MKQTPLSTYLNDHLGLMTAEHELLQRMLGEDIAESLAVFLRSHLTEVAAQEAHLKLLLENLGYDRSLMKQAAGWLAEKIGRLKPNDSLMTYTPLSTLVELEALAVAATARLCMWDALAETAHNTAPLGDRLEFEQRRAESESQLQAIQLQRSAFAAIALSG